MVCSGKLVDLGEGPAQLLLEANAPSALIAMLNEGRSSAPVSHCPPSSFGHVSVVHRVSALVLRLFILFSHIPTMLDIHVDVLCIAPGCYWWKLQRCAKRGTALQCAGNFEHLVK